jgi:hypothetical protein
MPPTNGAFRPRGSPRHESESCIPDESGAVVGTCQVVSGDAHVRTVCLGRSPWLQQISICPPRRAVKDHPVTDRSSARFAVRSLRSHDGEVRARSR